MRNLKRPFLGVLLLFAVLAPLRAQYNGGAGDGHDMRKLAFVITVYDATTLFGGGSGDGHDLDKVSFLLTAYDGTGLYGGGSGDGHDVRDISFSPATSTPVALFGGGSGDGHDVRDLDFLLTSYDPAGLYTGGDGDGHDVVDVDFILTAYDPARLFSGGGGDGHDMADEDLLLTAYDATALFSGSGGDGHDMARLIFDIALPLTVVTFDAIPRANSVLLRWVTADEFDTDYFTIEKSRAGDNFVRVGTLPAAGYSAPGTELHYELPDEQPWTGTSYYRLRTTDFDGTFNLSDIRVVNFNGSAVDRGFTLFPNPNDGIRLSLQLKGEEITGPLQVRVVGSDGSVHLNRSLPPIPDGRYDISISDHRLPSGAYVVHISTAEGQNSSKQLIVLRNSR